jgi:hypothetical protein
LPHLIGENRRVHFITPGFDPATYNCWPLSRYLLEFDPLRRILDRLGVFLIPALTILLLPIVFALNMGHSGVHMFQDRQQGATMHLFDLLYGGAVQDNPVAGDPTDTGPVPPTS